MNLFVSGCILLMFLSSVMAGKTLLERQTVYRLLDDQNPYIGVVVANQKLQESKLLYTQGEFDTKLGAKHDEKQYPLSDARFSDVYLEKPLENGLEMTLGYRKAYGVQEYNNIKTGDEGEFRAGVKFPVVELMQGMNPRKLSLQSAQIDTKRASSEMTNRLRTFYTDVTRAYYQLLFRHELMSLEQSLLEKAKVQYGLIEKRVSAGDEAPIVLVEARQLVNERQQRWIESVNMTSTSLEELITYLNMTRNDFETSFEIPSLPKIPDADLDVDRSIQMALEKRPDIEILEFEKEKLLRESTMAQVLKYPKLDAALYGVHDPIYQNGFKVSLEMSFPLERQKYQGKNSEIRLKQQNNVYEMKKSLLEVQRQIQTTVDTASALKESLKVVEDEIALAEELERAEMRKFEMGDSGLFLLNQRQMKTLQAKQKKAQYHLKLLLGLLELEKETGKLDEAFSYLIQN